MRARPRSGGRDDRPLSRGRTVPDPRRRPAFHRHPGFLRRLDADASRLRDAERTRCARAGDPLLPHGHPVLPRVAETIKGLADFFRTEWPTSYETWLPCGVAPEPKRIVRNPVLAQTWTRIIAEAEAAGSREAQIEAARDAFYRGFVAEAIAKYLAKAEVMDASGTRHKGVLSADDMAGWSATVEDAGDLRLSRLDGRQDRAMGTRTGPPSVAGCSQGLRHCLHGSLRRRIRAHSHGSYETRLCRPRGLLRRPGILRCPARPPAERRLRGWAPQADWHVGLT